MGPCRVHTLLLVATLSAASVTAQTSKDAPAPQPGSVAPAYTIRSGTQLVVLDVIVKDKKGNIVHNLKPTDFLVKENGTPQTIRDFEEHKTLSEEQLTAVPARPSLPPGQFTNYVPTPPNGALNIILYDANNTSAKDQAFMRTQLIQYLKHARPDARTAIFGLNTHLILLQGFTSDPAMLLAAIENKGKPQQSMLRDSTSGGLQLGPESGNFGNAVKNAIDSVGLPLPPQADKQLDNADKVNQGYQNEVRAYTTLDGLNDLARTLAAIPGRKNLIWFAGDFPPDFFPSENTHDGPYAMSAALDSEFRDTVNLLARAQVAVYPVDAQGLRTDHTNGADYANGTYKGKDPGASTPGAGATLRAAGLPELNDHQDEFKLVSSEHQAMLQIARDTGGEAFFDHNDLTRAVREAIDNGSNFYTLTYDPRVDMERDGLRSISVKVNGGDYQLSYRHGYFSDRSHRIAAANGPAAAPPSALAQALAPGSPEPTQILLRARAVPVGGPNEPSVLATNNPNPDPKKMHGPFRTIQVSTAASVLEMSFAHGADNIFHADVDFVTNVYDASGTLINSQSNTVRTAYTKEKLALALRSGLLFNQQISVPAKGEYFLRIAVHDSASGHVGAIEIPVEAVTTLPTPDPATAAAALPATHP